MTSSERKSQRAFTSTGLAAGGPTGYFRRIMGESCLALRDGENIIEDLITFVFCIKSYESDEKGI